MENNPETYRNCFEIISKYTKNLCEIEPLANGLLDIYNTLSGKSPEENAPHQARSVPDVVTACEINGQQHVRVHVGKYDFVISLHEAPETMGWEDAMKYAEDKGMRLFTLEEGLIMFCFKDEINAKMEELGGDPLNEDCNHWSGTESNRHNARYVGFSGGFANITTKYYGNAVRPVAA